MDRHAGGQRARRVAATRAGGRPSAPSGVVSSTGTTASAPAGSGAPVAIRIAVPGSTHDRAQPAGRDLADDPQPDRAVSVAPATSAARIA